MANDQYRGAQRPNSSTSEFNAQSFLIRQILASVSTAKLVKIVAVTNAGELSPVGFVDVQPMVNQIDGDGGAVAHGVVYNVPYFRLQGGADAVIIDPKTGDIGICIFADNDISNVKTNKAISDPGSKRKFNMSDGLYVGGVLNGTPSQFIRFSEEGVDIVSPTKIKFTAPEIEFVAETSVLLDTPNTNSSGTVSASVDVVGGGKSLKTHRHSGVQPGGGTTGAPV